MNFLKNRAQRTLLLIGSIGLVGAANAAGEGVDVTAAVAAITGSVATVALIGNADLVVKAAVKAFSYARSALGR